MRTANDYYKEKFGYKVYKLSLDGGSPVPIGMGPWASGLPPEIVVHRITGDGARRELIAPLWSLDKKRVLNYLNGLLGTGQNRQKGI